MLRIDLPLIGTEIGQLRALLSQTAAPGSVQGKLISRIDAALEEATRSRRPREERGHLRIRRDT